MKVTMSKSGATTPLDNGKNDMSANALFALLMGGAMTGTQQPDDIKPVAVNPANPDEAKSSDMDVTPPAAQVFAALEQLITDITQNQTNAAKPAAETVDMKNPVLPGGQAAAEVMPNQQPGLESKSLAFAAPLPQMTQKNAQSALAPAAKQQIEVAAANASLQNMATPELQQLMDEINQNQLPKTESKSISFELPEQLSQTEQQTDDVQPLLTSSKSQQPVTDKMKIAAQTLTESHQKLTASQPGTAVATGLQGAAAQNEGQFNKVNAALNKWAQRFNLASTVRTDGPQNMANTAYTQQAANALSQTLGQETPASQAGSGTNMAFRIEAIETLQAPMQGQQHDNGVYHATIKVTPAEFGPITAKIKVDKNKAVVDIMATNSHAAAMIKAHLPELKEQFNLSSLQIDKITISDMNTPRQEQHQQEESASSQHSLADAPEPAVNRMKNSENTRQNADALIDTYI